jgi:hypothetical protein
MILPRINEFRPNQKTSPEPNATFSHLATTELAGGVLGEESSRGGVVHTCPAVLELQGTIPLATGVAVTVEGGRNYSNGLFGSIHPAT